MIKIGLYLGCLLRLHSSMPQGDFEDKDCTIFSDFGYYCVPYYQCNKTGFITTDGDQILDPRSVDDEESICPDHDVAQRGHCNDLLEVCCLLPDPSSSCKQIPKEPEISNYDYEDYYYEDDKEDNEKEEYRDNYEEDYKDNYDDLYDDSDYDEGCVTDDIFGARGEEKSILKDCNKENKCEDFKSQGFACAEYWRCFGKERISDGSGVIDLRQNIRPIQGECVHLENATLDASDDKCDGENQVCCKNPDMEVRICDPEVKENDDFGACGRTNSRRTGSLVTLTQLNVTKAAQPGEFPHMCVIYKVENEKTEYVGGASLIARNKVITVAHKFLVSQRKKITDERRNLEKFRVSCGKYNVKAEAEIQQSQQTGILALHFHPQYDPNNKFVPNDLVIIETIKPFVYQEHIGPVCLPRPNDNFENDEDCWSSGWGKDQFGETGKFSDILKKIDMKIVNKKMCRRKYRKTKKRFLKSFTVHKSQICVGGEKNKDTCTGDGGSPHVCLRDNKWTQVGAVAWGIGCGSRIPAVYASIPDAMCWVDWIMTCKAEKSSASSSGTRTNMSLRTPLKSLNRFSQEECGEWARENERMMEEGKCFVNYANQEEDVLEEIFDVADSDIFTDLQEYEDIFSESLDYDIRSTEPKRLQRDFRG